MAISDQELANARGISLEQVRLLRQARGATNDTLNGLSEAALIRSIRRLNYPDQPRARQAFRAEQSKNSDGRVPPLGLNKALKQLRTFRARTSARAFVAGIPVNRAKAPAGAIARVAGLATGNWTWIGPGNIGGRTRALAIHPRQPNKMWAASAGGGIWHSADGGAQWQPVDDFMANLAVSCLAMDPKHPDTIYAGTGEGYGNLDAIRGAGVFVTRDGVTWRQIAATANASFSTVNRLAVSPGGGLLLAATGSGLYRCIDAARATWTKVLDAVLGDVKYHPRLSTRAVAGGVSNGTAYYSTTSGRTWQPASHSGVWSGRVELAYAAKDPNIVYASVQNSGGEIWRSTDGGKTYRRCAAQSVDAQPAHYLGDQGWYGNTIWAGDPTNDKLVIVGGINLWRSLDGGKTLTEISTWWDSGSVHADHHAIVSHPAYDGKTNRTVFFGNDGGIYKAADIKAVGVEAGPPYVSGWTRLVNNYGVTQFYGGAGNPVSGKIIGGAQDNGTICFDPAGGPGNWKTIFGGDGGFCAADPADPNVFYGEYVYLNIHRNLDGGMSDDNAGDRYISGQFWNGIARDWQWKPVPFRIGDAMNSNALFIAPFALDPNNPNRILAGGVSLWRTNDAKTPNTPTAGPSWAAIKSGVGAPISAIAIARGNSDVVWVGHSDGQVFKSVNGTQPAPAWLQVSGAGAQPLNANRYCTCITIDPTDNRTVYVAFGGYSAGNVWATHDGGATWSIITAALPAAPARSVAVHPRRPSFLYVGTEVGIFGSEDGGAHWSVTNEGPANCAVDQLFWMNETLVCATHGRGMYQIDLSAV